VWDARGKAFITHQGDMLFTHFGLSGPIALRCSQFIVKQQKKTGERKVTVSIDLFPDQTVEQWYKHTLGLAEQEDKKAIKNVLKPVLPERLIPILLRGVNLDEQVTFHNIPRQQWMELSKLV